MDRRARNLLISILIALCLGSQALASPGVNSSIDSVVKDKWALVVGISQFRDSSIDLKYAAKDATDFADFLVSHERFARDHVKLLLNQEATRERFLDELGEWLPRAAMPEDLVVLFVSTHGSPSSADIGGVNYLVAYDTDKDHLFSTGIAMQELNRLIKERVHASRVVILLDACHSGAVKAGNKALSRQNNFDAAEIAMGSGQLVICSSEPQQSSWESRNCENGVFTHRLIEAFQVKGNRTTLGEAFQYMQDKVSEEVLHDRAELQRPVLKSAWEGKDLELAVQPSKPRRAPPSSSLSIAEARTQTTNEKSLIRSQPLPQSSASIESQKLSDQSVLNRPSPAMKTQTLPSGLWHAQNSDGTVNGLWKWDMAKQQFVATWSNGSVDYLKIDKFDDNDVVLSGRNALGMKVHFFGKRHDNFVSGTADVDLNNNGPLLKWDWQASW